MSNTPYRVALVLLLVGTAVGGEQAVPDYRLPEELRGTVGDHPEVVARAVLEITEGKGGPSSEATKVLAGLGRAAVPAVVRALPEASWFARSLLMASLAESGVPEVGPLLVTGAHDPSWAVREMAAVGLGRVPGPEVEDELHSLLADPSWRVRRAAAESLRRQVTRGRCDRPRAVAALLRLTGDRDHDVRLAALVELGRLEADEGREVFLSGFRGEDDQIREACFKALTHLTGSNEDLVAAMAEALGRSDDEVFIEAAEKYADLTGPRILEDANHVHRLLMQLQRGSHRVAKVFEKAGPASVPILLDHLRSFYRSPTRVPARDLGRTVLDLVEKLLKEDAAPVLAEVLANWQEAPAARRHAVVLARRYHARTLAGTFKDLYRKEGYSDIRASLLQAIAAADAPDLDEFLRDAILSGNSGLQKRAYRILKEREEIDVDDAVIQALQSERDDYTVAGRWLSILVSRKNPAALEQAATLLRRPHPNLRLEGADWLRAFRDPDKVLPLLAEALRKEDGRDWERDDEQPSGPAVGKRIRIVATILQSARKVGGARSLPLFEEALSFRKPELRQKALFELGKIRGARALKIGLGALERETDPAARREALRAVCVHDHPVVRELLERRLSGEDELERLEVLRALRSTEAAHLPEAVTKALASGDWEPEARLLAVEVLQANGGPEHVPLLIRLLEEDPDTE
ncbi:MAG: HEAT repeat domain-containing protein, partial [Planctomycetota bacterium]